ncbi:hypothetical protein [Kitasatospora sp. LaBMicrA B282]|uniref:hypothetical protein n=1 Tax=Kitasatospora sp. LaBMicrA B282 TaxID=3420949 RepID=UPI003D0AF075
MLVKKAVSLLGCAVVIGAGALAVAPTAYAKSGFPTYTCDHIDFKTGSDILATGHCVATNGAPKEGAYRGDLILDRDRGISLICRTGIALTPATVTGFDCT